MTLETFLDYLGIRLDGPKAAGKTITVNVRLTDTGETAVLHLANGSLSHSPGRQQDDADATLAMARTTLDDIALGVADVATLVEKGAVAVTGDGGAVRDLLSLLDTFELWFNIVTP